MRVPVVGVFYSEVEDVNEWLDCVELQATDRIDPIPVVVQNWHGVNGRAVEEKFRNAVAAKRISRENYFVLKENLGHTGAFNAAVEKLVELGDISWIASLDPDARLAPRSLDMALNFTSISEKVGMVSPLIVKPRCDGNYIQEVRRDETVTQAGHFPRKTSRHTSFFGVNHGWASHFRGRLVETARKVLACSPCAAPFTACFCAGLWRASMFRDIGLPDPLQFRTMNCAEIGYRAQLQGWSGLFAPDSVAFHKQAKRGDFDPLQAIDFSYASWQFHHARTLIALKYYPDAERPSRRLIDNTPSSWRTLFPCLDHLGPVFADEVRSELFSRWEWFASAELCDKGA